jgi:Squalene-hopene cyclase C-terminal domain/Prenyltransferase and squalene oxidase repeat
MKTNKLPHLEYAKSLLTLEQLKASIVMQIEGEPNEFYLHYVSLFAKQETATIEQINIAGYFYYLYALQMDKAIDRDIPSEERARILFLSDILHEENTKILTHYFGIDSPIWKLKAKRRAEYIGSISQHKNFLYPLSQSEFENLADAKSALGKIAIDCVFLLDKLSHEEYEKLLVSHKYFSCGLQIYDDIKDIKEDIINQQNNFAITEFLKQYPEEEHENIISNPDKLNKLLFYTGSAKTLLLKAIDYLQKAYQIIERQQYPHWVDTIIDIETEIKKFINGIDFLSKKVSIRSKLSHEKSGLKIVDSEINYYLPDSIFKALEFIENHQNEDGNWEDMPVNGSFSGYWTIGYVLYSIRNLKGLHQININKSIKYLQDKDTIIYPYFQNWIEDADSTNFALLGLAANDTFPKHEYQELFNYQLHDGGITTYNDGDRLYSFVKSDSAVKDVSGWTQSFVCVSAATLLLIADKAEYDTQKDLLTQYLLAQQNKDGLWYSYWWTSPIYATSLVIQANAKMNHDLLNDACKLALSKIMQNQQPNGAFGDDFLTDHLFYTAMIISAVCVKNSYLEKYQPQVLKAIQWLLENQMTDGSWQSAVSLRIPPADCLNPAEVENWRKSDLGQNALIEDIHRIITTATVLDALASYANISKVKLNSSQAIMPEIVKP